MIAALAPVAALLLSVAMLLMGNGLQSTLLPLRAGIEQFSSVQIGVLGSAYFVGFALGCWRGAVVVRRAGHIRAFAAVVAIASTSALVHALIQQPVLWWFVRFLTGACVAILFMIIESWLNEKATNETRGTVFSVYSAINLAMVAAGQLLLAAGEPGGFPLFLLASILVSLAAVPVALSRSESPAPIDRIEVHLGKLFRLSPVGFIGCLIVGMANGAFWGLAPLFAQASNPTAGTGFVALFIGIAVAAGAAGQWPLGLFSDRMDRRKVIIVAAALAGLSGVALALFGAVSETVMLLAVFGFGMFAFPLYALSVAHANDFVGTDSFVEAAGGLLLTWAVGAVVGPIAASALISFTGQAGLFWFTAAAHGALVVLVVLRMRKRHAQRTEEMGNFVDAINAGLTVAPVEVAASHEAPASEGAAPVSPEPETASGPESDRTQP